MTMPSPNRTMPMKYNRKGNTNILRILQGLSASNSSYDTLHSVSGIFTEGIFTNGIFATGIFTERNFRQKEISPNGIFATRNFCRTEFSPSETLPNGIFAENYDIKISKVSSWIYTAFFIVKKCLQKKKLCV